MKLLQINTTVNYEATGRIAEEIGQTAMAHGWESHIAYGRFSNGSRSHVFKIGTQRDVYIHKLHSFLLDRHGLASKRATRELTAYIESVSPDIVHLHNLHGFYLNYPILFRCLSQLDVPVVWTLHDCWSFTGHCSHYDYAKCYLWKTRCHDCPQKRSVYPPSWFADRSARNFRDKKRWFTSLNDMTIVPVSAWLAGEVKDSFLGKYPIHLIHNGINTDAFSPQPVSKKDFGLENKFVILGVSNFWTWRKGLDDFGRLRTLLPEEFAIVLVGLAPKQINELPEGIVGIPRTSSLRELAEYYSLADVFVNPTWEDTFPTTNLEALACGTPVITYRTGGSVEAVDDRTGFIVEQGDTARIAAIVADMKATGKQPYTEFCRSRALACFDKRDRYMEYLRLYDDLLATRK